MSQKTHESGFFFTDFVMYSVRQGAQRRSTALQPPAAAFHDLMEVDLVVEGLEPLARRGRDREHAQARAYLQLTDLDAVIAKRREHGAGILVLDRGMAQIETQAEVAA